MLWYHDMLNKFLRTKIYGCMEINYDWRLRNKSVSIFLSSETPHLWNRRWNIILWELFEDQGNAIENDQITEMLIKLILK